MADTLAQWVIEMSATGQAAVAAALERTRQELGVSETAAKAYQGALDAAGRAGQSAALAAVRGNADAARSYERLRRTIEEIAAAVRAGRLTEEEARNAVTEATFRATLALEKRQQAEKAAAKLEAEAAKAATLALQQRQRGQAALIAGFGLASAGLLSFVRAGLAETAQGEMMRLQFQLINREIAALFLPAINNTVQGLIRTTAWFRSLSGEQQNNIGKWVLIGVGALGVAATLPKVVAGVNAVGAALRLALTANPILLAAGAFAALLLSTESGRRSLANMGERLQPAFEKMATAAERLGPALEKAAASAGKVAEFLTAALDKADLLGARLGFAQSGPGSLTDRAIEGYLRTLPGVGTLLGVADLIPQGVREGGTRTNHQNLDQRGGGFESVTDTFRRIQSAANRTDIPARQLTVLEQIRDAIRMNPASPNAAWLARWVVPAVAE